MRTPKMLKILLFTLVLNQTIISNSNQVNYEANLEKYLFSCNPGDSNCTTYNKNLRPVKRSESRIYVNASIGIKRIYEMDEKNQKVVLFALILMKWQDELLKWSPADFGGLNFTYVSFKRIWTPKLELITNRRAYSNDNYHEQVYQGYPVKLNYNGMVEFVPSLYLTSDCLFNYDRYPFDIQFCNFVFQMPYDIKQMALSMSTYYTIEYHTYDQIWKIDDFNNVPSIDQSNNNPTNTLQIKFVRQVRNYLYTMPSYIVYILTLLMFLLPQTSNQRIIVGSTTLIIATMLAYTMSISLPNNEISAWPLLGKLFLFNIVLLTFSLLFSAFILKISHQDHLKTVPDWVKRFF